MRWQFGLKLLGERHPDTAQSLNHPSVLCCKAKVTQLAHVPIERALAIRLELVGERHPDTALSLNHLGELLRAQGDLAGARPYLEQALAIRSAMLGERHPATAQKPEQPGRTAARSRRPGWRAPLLRAGAGVQSCGAVRAAS